MERHGVFVAVVLAIISCLFLLSVGFAKPIHAGMRAVPKKLTKGPVDSEIGAILIQRDRRQDDDNDGSQDDSEDQDNAEDSNVSQDSEGDETEASQSNEASQDNESEDEQSQGDESETSQNEQSEDNESQDNEQSESQASQDSEASQDDESQGSQESEASQDDESQGSEDDEQSQDQDEQSQDSESQATEASQNDETQSSQDDEQSQGSENQGSEQSQNDESQASQDNEESQSSQDGEQSQTSENQGSEQSQNNESQSNQDNEASQDNESEASQDEQSRSEASQDEQSQDNDNEQSESQASQDNEASQDDESQGSQDTGEQSQGQEEQSQDNESLDSEQSESQASQDDEQSQNDESQGTQDDEHSHDQSQNEQSQGGNMTNQDGNQSQDNEENPEEDSNANHDEENQAEGEASEASQDSEQSQGDNSAEESQDDTSQDDNDESQESDRNQSLDSHTAPPDFEGTCAADELLDLSEGAAVGEVAVGHCESGLFEGTWICRYNSELHAAKWVQIECNAPEDLEFATTAELIVADPVEAVGTVLKHISNHTLNLEVAASILERIMLVPAPTSKLLISSHYTAEYTTWTLCQLSSMLGNLETLPKEERASAATKLLHAMDVFALKYVDSSESGEIDCGSVKVKVKDIVPGVDVVGIKVGQNSIVMPNSELRHSIGHSSVKAASFFFEDLSDILLDNATKSGSSVVTPVISTALLCGNALCNTSYLELSRPIKITLEQSVPATTNNNTEKNQQRHDLCSFWQLLPNVYYPSTGTWSQRGCTMNKAESTSRTTVCECNHLTHFAVLLSPGVEFGKKHEFALRTIGYIGITISLFAMAITVFINMCFRSLWSMRTYIHIHLCLSLMAALLLFVVAIDKTGNKIGCSVVAIALHYLFLVSFMWMLMEGVVLYVLLVKVFVEGSQRKYIIQFTVLSYGLPALYMCVTVPLGFLLNGEWHYGSDEMCWLRYDTHFVWAFIAPVILIIMINVGFFIMAIVIMYKHQHKKKDSGKSLTARKWIKTAASLTSVMGLTWITGVIVFHKALIPVAYIFTIFVAFEGVAIFVLFVVVSKQVREALLVCVRDRVNDSEFLSEHIGTRLEKLTPNSTKSRKESNLQYYKNLQKQRRESNERSKALSQANLKLHYINTNTHGYVINNEASVNEDLPSSCSTAAADTGVNSQEYETQNLEVMVKDGETVATQI